MSVHASQPDLHRFPTCKVVMQCNLCPRDTLLHYQQCSPQLAYPPPMQLYLMPHAEVLLLWHGPAQSLHHLTPQAL